MADSSIEWCDKVWNPVRGCALVSPGCENCYAMKQAHRFSASGQPYAGLTVLGKHGPRWTGAARFVPEMLDAPLRWKKPARIFVNSMSDLFHDDVIDEQIAAVFGVMAACPQHTFQVLTKRPERMRAWFERIAGPGTRDASERCMDAAAEYLYDNGRLDRVVRAAAWPLPNVWLGVSCEDQKRADERIPLLLQVPAAVRFVSAEPLLGAISFTSLPHPIDPKGAERYDALDGRAVWSDGGVGLDNRHLDWIIVGGESGPGARPCNAEHIRSIVRQCKEAGVAVFVKQIGRLAYSDKGGKDFIRTLITRDRKGGDMSEWPEDLRVREFAADKAHHV